MPLYVLLCFVLTACCLSPSTAKAGSMPSSSAPVLQPAPSLMSAAPSVTRLPNGLTVLIQEDDRFPLVSIRLYVHAGSAFEEPAQAGISHMLEHMVFKGTRTRAPGQVAQEIESAGGYLNAATSFDYTMYVADMPAERWELGLEVIQDMIFGAAIDPEELASEKKVVLAELERGEDAPGSRIFKELQALTWPGTTLSRPVIGTRETVQAITAEDIRAYIDKMYQPQGMLVVVCGRVRKEEALAKATALFGGLENRGQALPPQPLHIPTMLALAKAEGAFGGGPLVRAQALPLNKTYVGVAFPIPSFRSAKSTALEMLAYLLGGDRTSLLYRKFKYEKQLVDSIACSAVMLERVGMLYIQATLDTENLERFWEALMGELAGLKASGFSPESMARAKLNLEDDLFQAKETIAGLASKLGFFQFFENSLLAEENYFLELAAVDEAMLDARIAEYVRPERLVASVIVPGANNASTNASTNANTNATTNANTNASANASANAAPSGLDPAARAQRLEGIARATWAKARPETDAPAFGQGSRGEPETVPLAHGRSLVLMPDATLPYTALSLVMRGGDHLIGPDKQGLAELAAWLLSKGVGDRNATAIQDFLADRATSVSVSAHRDLFAVHLKFPTRFSADVLGFFEELLASPTFPEEELARERRNLVAAIKKREDQPMGLALRHVFPFLFKDHPYGYFHQGLPDVVAGLSRQDVLDFWNRQRAMPWTLAVCGEFDRAAMLALAKRLEAGIGGETSRETLTWTAPRWGQGKAVDLHLAERNQAHLLLAFPLPGLDNPDTPGLTLLRATLAGMSGRLFADLRDRQGLAYTVTAFLWQSPTTGALFFYIGTYPDKMDQALEGFRAVAAALNDTPLPEAELERGKNVLTGEYYREHQSLGSRTDEAATLLTQGYPLSLSRDQLAKAQTLTPADLQALARKYLDWDTAYLLRVTP